MNGIPRFFTYSSLIVKALTPTLKVTGIVIFCFSAFILSASAQSFTYYVDSANGNDSNPGSEAAPWRTIAKVNSTYLYPGQSVGFKAGDIWRETLNVSQSGRAGSPIVFGSYGGGNQPIIDGSTVLSSGWTRSNGRANVWQHPFSPINAAHIFVFFNGAAGGPNGGTPQSSAYNIASANQWYFDGRTLYVYSTSDPGTAFTNPGIEATSRPGVVAPTRSYVTFQNLNVRKSDANCFDMYNVQHGTVQYSTTSYCGGRGIAFYNGSNYAEINGNVVSYSGETGISLDDSNYSQIYANDTSHSGVLQDDFDGIGIWRNSTGNYVFFNYSHDNNDQTGPAGIRGIELDTITSPYVNYVHDNTVTRNNASGLLVEASSNQVVWNNLSYNNYHTASGGNAYVSGIKDSNGSSNIFYNNTTYGNQFSELQITTNGGSGPIVKNNLFFGTSSEAAVVVANGSTPTAGTHDYNLLYGTGTLVVIGSASYSAANFYRSTGLGQHDVFANPLLTTTSADYIQSLGFGLSPGSPAIGSGLYISGITSSNPANIGAN